MVLFVVVEVAVVAVVCFFIGSINPATLLARALGRDLRASGSGNPGATNAGRVLIVFTLEMPSWNGIASFEHSHFPLPGGPFRGPRTLSRQRLAKDPG